MRRQDPIFDRLMAQIRAYMPDYLAEKGVQFDKQGKIRCVNPDHDDNTPSMGYLKKDGVTPETFLKCFGCGAAYDIFHLANIFERKPLEGKGFLFDNVYYLADKFGIPHEKTELSERELAELRQERLYAAAADVLVDLIAEHEEWQTYPRERGLSRELCLQQGVGVVPWTVFESALIARDFNREFIRGAGIGPHLINDDHCTITLRDYHGRVVGFDRRFIDYDPQQHAHYRSAGEYYPPKYQISNQEKCLLLQKEALLYGIHVAKKHPMKRLDVFESYMDWLTAVQAGHPCCAALCGTSLTDIHVEIIRECGFRHVNLVLNGDDAGMTSMTKYLQKFRNKQGLRVTCMFLGFAPEIEPSSRDVDFYLKAFGGDLRVGLTNYFKHKPTSAFDHQLGQYLNEPDMDGPTIVKEMVGFILNEESPVQRGVLCKVLAEATKVPEEDIRAEIAAIEDKTIESFIDQMMRSLRFTNDSRMKHEILKRTVDDLEEAKVGPRDVVRPDESVEYIRDTYEQFQGTRPGETGWHTGLSNWDENLGGIRKSKEVYCILGGPNVGKSAIVKNMEVGLLKGQEEPCVIVLSLDDPRRTAIAKIHSVLSGFTISDVVTPQDRVFPDPGLKQLWVEARDQILDWADAGRLVIHGSQSGSTTDALERLIKATQDQTGRPVVVFGDSFHNLDGNDEERTKYKKAFQWIQDTTDWWDYTAVWTLEMTKAGMKGKGRFYDASETGKIAYGAKLVAVAYNELHDKREFAKTYWLDTADDPRLGDVRRPVIELEIEKNKIESFKGTLYFKFRDSSGQVYPTSREELKNELASMGALASNPTDAQDILGGHNMDDEEVPF